MYTCTLDSVHCTLVHCIAYAISKLFPVVISFFQSPSVFSSKFPFRFFFSSTFLLSLDMYNDKWPVQKWATVNGKNAHYHYKFWENIKMMKIKTEEKPSTWNDNIRLTLIINQMNGKGKKKQNLNLTRDHRIYCNKNTHINCGDASQLRNLSLLLSFSVVLPWDSFMKWKSTKRMTSIQMIIFFVSISLHSRQCETIII